ncbi:hypothetical protein MNV49_003129 [Pseudohyphozyma bogoriensis]|nr:hypothetical protein MNV49_003129 [Pseudohyphozyma bogoriensis]
MFRRSTHTLSTISKRSFATSAYALAHHRVVVVGAGTGGITAAAQLENRLKGSKEELKEGDLVILDDSKLHHYQPGWTLAGTGLKDLAELSRPTSSLVPPTATLVPKKAIGFEPKRNAVKVEGDEITRGSHYDYLIIAAGLQTNLSAIKGLKEGLEDPNSGVVSVYNLPTVEKTAKKIDEFDGGKAIFTQPFGIIKCAGAPQKVMWMALSTFKNKGIKIGAGKKGDVEFVTGMPAMFAVPKYAKALNALREQRDVGGEFNTNLVSIDNQKKEATFKILSEGGGEVTKKFDLLHVVPPQGPLELFKGSEVADAAGWVSVSPATLQHTNFPNIFGLGDSSSLPTSKTAAAITGQVPVLVENLVSQMRGEELVAAYDGYTSCPLLTGHNELMLAEFKYGAEPKESFSWLPFIGSQDVPRAVFYWLKTDFFPAVYWSRFVKGTWFGPKGIFRPTFAKSA